MSNSWETIHKSDSLSPHETMAYVLYKTENTILYNFIFCVFSLKVISTVCVGYTLYSTHTGVVIGVVSLMVLIVVACIAVVFIIICKKQTKQEVSGTHTHTHTLACCPVFLCNYFLLSLSYTVCTAWNRAS